MSDLTDEQLEWLRTHVMSTTQSEFQTIIEELQRRRAEPSGREHVERVVREAVLSAELAMAPFGTASLGINNIDAIVRKAADRLSVPVMNEEDLRIARKIRAEVDEYGMSEDEADSDPPLVRNNALAFLDRLLAGKP